MCILYNIPGIVDRFNPALTRQYVGHETILLNNALQLVKSNGTTGMILARTVSRTDTLFIYLCVYQVCIYI